MINDVSPPHGIKAFKYVDDMTLVETRTSAQPSRMQDAVTSLTEWSSSNNMSLNPSKCCVMNVSFSRNPLSPLRFSLMTMNCNMSTKLNFWVL